MNLDDRQDKPALSLQDIGFGYGSQTVVEAVTVDIRDGEFLALVGPNGCGKSTVLRIMAGLLSPAEGEVRLRGQPIASLRRKQIAGQLALLAQSNEAPGGMLVCDLVGMGRFAHEGWLRRDTPQDRQYIANAMRQMNVDDLGNRRTGELSGGQLQRCRMAMMLAQDADIQLLDEPTNHLDLKHQHTVLEIARQQAKAGRAVVAVLHDLTQASIYADRILLMADGRIIADGPPESVLTIQNIERVYGLKTAAKRFGRAIVHLPAGVSG